MWNYRIVRENGEYTIREVYYDHNKLPVSFTANPVKPIAFEDSHDPRESIRWQLEKMLDALNKPILIAETFPEEETPRSDYSNAAIIYKDTSIISKEEKLNINEDTPH